MTTAAWSTSFPGVITPRCGSVEGAFEVHHETGRMLRIGSEARLCFRCGPDGGVYHPWRPGLMQPGERRLSRVGAMDRVRAIAAEFDRAFNRLEVHSHHTFVDGHDRPAILHSHTDGSEPHKHPDAAPAWYGHRGEGHGVKPSKEPTGEQREYVELTAAERTITVVIPYQYINPSSGQQGRVRVGRPLTAREIKDLKPPPEWSRATWRASMEATVAVIRYPEVFALRAGGGAIDMTVDRMRNDFRLTPVYEIPGWKPTPWQGIP